MKSVCCLQMSLFAAAVFALSAVNAQPSVGASPAPAVTAAPPAQAQDGKKHQHMHHHRSHEKNHGHHGKPAAPHKHEHEAGHGPADGHWKEHAGPHAGDIRSDTLDQYQRNALARCEVFRVPEDRRSCVERMRSEPVSGSVKDGGVLREFTEQVLVPNERVPASEHP